MCTIVVCVELGVRLLGNAVEGFALILIEIRFIVASVTTNALLEASVRTECVDMLSRCRHFRFLLSHQSLHFRFLLNHQSRHFRFLLNHQSRSHLIRPRLLLQWLQVNFLSPMHVRAWMMRVIKVGLIDIYLDYIVSYF